MTRFVAWVWLGLVVGVSFVATPIKFTAESLTRPVALDVGRATFHLLNRIEIVLAVVLASLAWRAVRSARWGRNEIVLAGAIITIVALQGLWLLPRLDTRVAMVIDGIEPPSSMLHTGFGVLEVVKVVALGLLGHVAGAPRSRDQRPVEPAAADAEPATPVAPDGQPS